MAKSRLSCQKTRVPNIYYEGNAEEDVDKVMCLSHNLNPTVACEHMPLLNKY